MAETLGILVSSDRHLDDLLGLTRAAAGTGRQITRFNFYEDQDYDRLLVLAGKNPAPTKSMTKTIEYRRNDYYVIDVKLVSDRTIPTTGYSLDHCGIILSVSLASLAASSGR